mmetsp:Transcript_10051/g.21264  ORF Transcript_10051/g.21264 Transcript_10051/m.21264 type:complete len:209 (+) Transcript_10051:1142-1768(+)
MSPRIIENPYHESSIFKTVGRRSSFSKQLVFNFSVFEQAFTKATWCILNKKSMINPMWNDGIGYLITYCFSVLFHIFFFLGCDQFPCRGNSRRDHCNHYLVCNRALLRSLIVVAPHNIPHPSVFLCGGRERAARAIQRTVFHSSRNISSPETNHECQTARWTLRTGRWRTTRFPSLVIFPSMYQSLDIHHIGCISTLSFFRGWASWAW